MRNWFQHPTKRRATPRAHLRVEALEDRSVPSAANTFLQTDLVSDQPGVARVTDPNLVNPWGVAIAPTTGAFWVSDNNTGVATLYQGDVNGSMFQQVAGLPVVHGLGAPTGTVFNPTSDFAVGSATTGSKAATFIFVSEDGTITGWNAGVPPTAGGPSTQAQLAVKVDGAVFKGVALANNTLGTRQGNFLYVTDFHGGKIDVFDKNFQLVTLDGSFTDPNTPQGFAPFNVQAIGGKLYVTYAQQDAAKQNDVHGPGLGFVDVYDTDGKLLSRLASGGPLDAPWGVVQAPAGFGQFGGDVLVGNFGNGHVEAFDPNKPGPDKLVGELRGADGNPLVIPGLWALTFGNGISAGDKSTLYFTAGAAKEAHGLFGSLKPADTDVPAPNGSSGFSETNLVSDVPGLAPTTNDAFTNPWGIGPNAAGQFQVSANGSGSSFLVTADGQIIGQPITIPAPPGSRAGATSSPTGSVSLTGNNFMIPVPGAASVPATAIFATEDGTIAAFNPTLSPTTARLVVDQSGDGSVFKGVTVASNAMGNFVFATNFRNGTVDVFDSNFKKVTLGQNGFGTFADPNAPAGFAPFNARLVAGKLFVTYAKQDAAKHDDVEGAGNGFIDVFDTSGHFIQRFASGTAAGGMLTQLNSPFGLTVAPQGYGPGGKFGGALLVGNFGDSRVSAFDLQTGAFLGQLSDSNGNPLTLNGGFGAPGSKGLWAIGFGNGQGGADTNTLFFASGVNGEADGLFGKVTAAAATGSGTGSGSGSGSGSLTPAQQIALINQMVIANLQAVFARPLPPGGPIVTAAITAITDLDGDGIADVAAVVIVRGGRNRLTIFFLKFDGLTGNLIGNPVMARL